MHTSCKIKSDVLIVLPSQICQPFGQTSWINTHWLLTWQTRSSPSYYSHSSVRGSCPLAANAESFRHQCDLSNHGTSWTQKSMTHSTANLFDISVQQMQNENAFNRACIMKTSLLVFSQLACWGVWRPSLCVLCVIHYHCFPSSLGEFKRPFRLKNSLLIFCVEKS